MSFAQEACPVCGAVPDWYLIYRPQAAKRAIQREADGLPPDPKDAAVIWRLVYKHESSRPCTRFNAAHSFAPLVMATQARNGADCVAKVRARLQRTQEAA